MCFSYTPTQTSSTGEVIYKDKLLDLHVWCEDDVGNVVFDPMFPEYEMIWRIRKCKGDILYESIPEWMPLVRDSIRTNVKKLMEKKQIKDPYIASELMSSIWKSDFGMCVLNAYCHKFKNPEVNLVCGRFGKKKKSGGIHWEFG